MEYRVAFGKDEYDIAMVVNALIKEGWEPQGGVQFYKWGLNERFYQAMIKK